MAVNLSGAVRARAHGVTTAAARGTALVLITVLLMVAASPAQGVSRPPSPALFEPLPAAASAVTGQLSAEHWVLVEATSGQVIAAHRHEVRRPVASTVKMLTALSVIDRVPLDDVVLIGEEVTGVDGAGVGLQPGDVWTVEQLLDALIARSGNDAAEALAVHVAGDRESFVELMLDDAALLGIDGAYIDDPSGLDDTNLLSAHDLAIIAMAALDHPELRDLLGRAEVDLPGEGIVESRNELLATYQGATGVKTGFTSMAGNALVGSASRQGRELLAVVLGADDDPARFVDVATLLDLGFDATTLANRVFRAEVAIAGGQARFASEEVAVTTPHAGALVAAPTLPARAPELSWTLPLLIDGIQLGSVEAARTDTVDDVATPGGAVSRAIVDGIYTGLRAGSAAGTLG